MMKVYHMLQVDGPTIAWFTCSKLLNQIKLFFSGDYSSDHITWQPKAV